MDKQESTENFKFSKMHYAEGGKNKSILDYLKGKIISVPFFTLLTFVFGVIAFVLEKSGVNFYITYTFWGLGYFTGAWFGMFEVWRSLKKFKLNIDLLMLLGAFCLLALNELAEGVVLLFLFSLSNALEDYSIAKSRDAIRNLIQLRPKEVNIKQGDIWVVKKLEEVQLDDICLVKPGENIPTDALVISGRSDVDQSAITGESNTILKTVGDLVYAGSSNKTGFLEIKVNKLLQDSTLYKMIELVELSQKNKLKAQNWLERFEKYYVLFVLAVAFIIIIPTITSAGSDFSNTWLVAITWLVVASPCALMLAIPASTFSAISKAAKNGLLIKGGINLNLISEVEAIAFDKTGTLTYGRPILVKSYVKGLSLDQVVIEILPIEVKSEHLLAKSLLSYARQNNLEYDNQAIVTFKAVPGCGLVGSIEDVEYYIGNQSLFIKYGINIPLDFIKQSEEISKVGCSLIFVAKQHKNLSSLSFIAVLGFTDKIRNEAKHSCLRLKKIGIKQLVMLTGDNKSVAASIASEAGIDEFYANLLPQDKVDKIKEISKNYKVAMIGDGINDAPALAESHLGISMGQGATDLSIDTAKVVLMSNDLRKIEFLIELARKTKATIIQNLVFSLLVISILSTINFIGILPVSLGVLLHESSTVLVVMNGLRLLFFK